VVLNTIRDYLYGENAFVQRIILYGANDEEVRPWQHAVDQLREQLTLPPLEAVEETVGS